MASSNSTFATKARESGLSATSSDYENESIPSSAVPLSGFIRPKSRSRRNTNKWKPFDFDFAAAYRTGDPNEADETAWPTAAEDDGLSDANMQSHRSQFAIGDGHYNQFTGTEVTQREPIGGMMDAVDLFNGVSKTSVAEQWPANTTASSGKPIPLGIQHLPKSSVEYVRPETSYKGPPSNQRQFLGADSNNQQTATGAGSALHRQDLTLDMRLGNHDNVIPQDWYSQQRNDSGYATRTTGSRPSFSSERSFLQATEMPMPSKNPRSSFTFEGRDLSMYGAKEGPRTFGSNPSGHNSRGTGNPEFTFQFPKTQNQGLQWLQQPQFDYGERTTQRPQRPYTHSQEAYIESERKRIAAIIAKSQLSQRSSFPSYGEQQTSDRFSPPKQAPARTVLYDPMQSRQGNAQDPITQVSEKPLSNISHSDAAVIPFHKTFRPLIPQSQPDKPPRSSGSLGSGNTLRASEPEPGWQDREARIYQGASSYIPQAAAPTSFGTNISSEQAGPTPQNWHGPFFQDDMEPHQRASSGPNADLGNMTRKVGRDRWWNSVSAHVAQGTSDLHTTTTIPISKADTTANAPLSLLFQNLSAYTSGPRDYFSKFAAPPDWCIDKSAAGQNSFFGEDWGKAPSRVGRDPRYRPLPVNPQEFLGRAGASGMGVGADGRRGLKFFAH